MTVLTGFNLPVLRLPNTQDVAHRCLNAEPPGDPWAADPWAKGRYAKRSPGVGTHPRRPFRSWWLPEPASGYPAGSSIGPTAARRRTSPSITRAMVSTADTASVPGATGLGGPTVGA